MRIQLLFFPGCPNVRPAEDALQRALEAAGLPTSFEKLDVCAATTPAALREWGSPTILVDGVDVGGERSPMGAACRLYRRKGLPTAGSPPEDMIREALERARSTGRGWLRSLALVPGALLALLPSATCPACIAAYAGALSAAGLGFLFTEKILAPLIVAFLVLGMASIAYSARSHRRLGPLLVTLTGTVAVAAGRLLWDVPAILYAGVALLIGAALWNLWLKRRPRTAPVQVERDTGGSTDGRFEMIQIKGMSCGGCAKSAESALRAVPGVLDAAIDFGSGNASITFRPGADPRAALAAISAHGLEGRLVEWPAGSSTPSNLDTEREPR